MQEAPRSHGGPTKGTQISEDCKPYKATEASEPYEATEPCEPYEATEPCEPYEATVACEPHKATKVCIHEVHAAVKWSPGNVSTWKTKEKKNNVHPKRAIAGSN